MTNNRQRGDATQNDDAASVEDRAVIDPTGQYSGEESAETDVSDTALYSKPLDGSKLAKTKPTGATTLLVAAGLVVGGYLLFFHKPKKGRRRR